MKFKVHFTEYDGYWVAEAENGAVSEGATLEECRANIADAISELEKDSRPVSAKRQIDELVEVSI